MEKKIDIPKEKQILHPRNRHRNRYNFDLLSKKHPPLDKFIQQNKYQNESIDFHDPNAVLALNTALLKHFYGMDYWTIPKGYLCPPIPGRADYIHYVADLLGSINKNIIPKGKEIRCLDIGVGANCVYPIIGINEYAWTFVGTDIDSIAIKNAQEIIKKNQLLKDKIELRKQQNSQFIFKGIVSNNEYFDLCICNPPFHSSPEEAQKGTRRKLSNLTSKKIKQVQLNFGGQQYELWREGGELKFINDMIQESKLFQDYILWFTCLVSKKSNLKSIYKSLKTAEVKEVKTIEMGQGNKQSRIVAWTFYTKKGLVKWANKNSNKE